jgi:hypothetical protein
MNTNSALRTIITTTNTSELTVMACICTYQPQAYKATASRMTWCCGTKMYSGGTAPDSRSVYRLPRRSLVLSLRLAEARPGFSSPWRIVHSGPGLPHYRGFMITLCETHHTRQNSYGRVIIPTQRSLPDNTQHSQGTDIHASGGIRTRNPSKRAAAEPRHWDRLELQLVKTIPNIHPFTFQPTSNPVPKYITSAVRTTWLVNVTNNQQTRRVI